MNNQKNVKKIVTFGEIMLRLAPYNFERLIQAKKFLLNWTNEEKEKRHFLKKIKSAKIN